MKLRPYQEELIADIKKEMLNGKKSVCTVLGCGGGKSVCAAEIAKSATEKGNRVLFFVHRKELCNQIEQTFRSWGVNMDLCQIGMVQTITRRLKKTEEPKIIITDEAHHALSDSYKRIYDHFSGALRIGFTATPIRMNEGGLGAVFDSMVHGVSTKWLIENNFLSPYRYFSVKLADATDLSVKRGDYDTKEIADLMENKTIYGETIKNYLKIAPNKKTIVYCASVESSKKTAEEFLQAGIKSVHIDGTTPPLERLRLVNDFKDNKIDVLCNMDLFGEGFDVPDCECVILLRPTKSLTLFIQQSMRSMRYKKGKTALIIDHVGNVFHHDFPDSVREWSLASKKKKSVSKVRIKECPKCYFVMPNTEKFCPECKYIFTAQQMKEATVIDVELEELNKLSIYAVKPYEFYKQIKTFEELVVFQKAKKYKFAWVVRKAIELKMTLPDKYKKMVDWGYI